MSNTTEILTISNLSTTNRKDVNELAQQAGYDNIRFFIAPDKKVSTDSVVEDVKSFLEREVKGESNATELFTV